MQNGLTFWYRLTQVILETLCWGTIIYYTDFLMTGLWHKLTSKLQTCLRHCKGEEVMRNELTTPRDHLTQSRELDKPVVVVVVVVEMNIIKVALSHFCCRTTIQSDSVSVSSQAGDSSSLVDSTRHIVSQPERTTGTAQSSVPVERQEEKAHPEPVVAECSMLVRQLPVTLSVYCMLPNNMTCQASACLMGTFTSR